MTTPTGKLFADPRVKPLSATGTQQPACTATFYLTGTTTPANVYADGGLTTPLANPVTSDSAGRFVAIYMDPGVIYRVVLNTAGATLISDTDPYVVDALLFPATAVEIATGLAINTIYPPGNLLRYGILQNSAGAAANNASYLGTLLKWSNLNGPTGLFYSPNTGGAASSPDTYFFSGSLITVRDNVTLDLNGCTWSFSKSSDHADDNNGFLWCMRNVTIQNGSIYGNYTLNAVAMGSTPPSFSIVAMGGRDAPVTGSNLPTIFDSQLTPFVNSGITMGNITLRNLYLNGTTNITSALIAANTPPLTKIGNPPQFQPTTGMYGIFGLGGLNGVRIENVIIEGNSLSSPPGLVGGLYYEFGWATGEASTHVRRTSHAHNWHVSNLDVRNISASSIANAAFGSNGGYQMTLDGVHISNSPAGISFGSGESLFWRPWVGVDDIGTLVQNGASPLPGTAAAGRPITLRNITARSISGTAIAIGGNSGTSGWAAALGPQVTGWLPNTLYANGAAVYNGTFKYLANGGGTSSNAAGFTGPVGTGTVTDGAGGTSWTFSAYAGGTGYNGWQAQTLYNLGDEIINGQYAYICTTSGTSAAVSQGPTGVGTLISDGAAKWSSIPTSSANAAPANSAYPACTDELNFTVDGFSVDSGTTGALSGGYGVNLSGGQTVIRNGKITNFSNAVRSNADATSFSIDNVTMLNSGSLGMSLGFTGASVFTPYRFYSGSIRNCFIAGSTGGAIAAAQTIGCIIENNRIGYEIAHDGIAETTQTQAVNIIGSASSGVVCRNNYVNTAGGAIAYVLSGTSVSKGCVIEDPRGPVQTYSGPWEGVLQSATVTLTCATPGNLAITYVTQKMDYIKRGLKIEYTVEIATSAFTHTTSSGTVSINGLPYAANNSAVGSLPMGVLAVQGITKAGYTSFSLQGSGGSSALTIPCSGSGQNIVSLAITDMPSAGTVKLFGSGHYFTSI